MGYVSVCWTTKCRPRVRFPPGRWAKTFRGETFWRLAGEWFGRQRAIWKHHLWDLWVRIPFRTLQLFQLSSAQNLLLVNYCPSIRLYFSLVVGQMPFIQVSFRRKEWRRGIIDILNRILLRVLTSEKLCSRETRPLIFQAGLTWTKFATLNSFSRIKLLSIVFALSMFFPPNWTGIQLLVK